MLRFNTFKVIKLGTYKIGSSFGVSQLHGAEEELYKLQPIPRESVESGKIPEENMSFQPTENDVNDDEYKLHKDTVVLLTANGSFTETNRLTGELYYTLGDENDR